MSDTKNNETNASSEKKKSATPIIAGVLVVLGAVVFGGLYASSQKQADSGAQGEDVAAAQDAAQAEPAAAETAEPAGDVAAEVAPTTPEASPEAAPAAASAELDIAALSKPRGLGNPDAPLKIAEHSSFTCGACAHYHSDNFKKIKADYIDTGKAYLVYDDFPRNIVDLEIGVIARCLPEESYFKFIQMMFETQQTWAKEAEYKKYLHQNALLAGLSEERYQACLKSEDLQKALASNREATMAKFDVKGTPSLVLNGSVVIGGTLPYTQIKDALDAELAKVAK